MQQTVTLNDQEVTEAIIEYASKHGVKFEGMQAEVSVIAGRKENGTYATIDLKPKPTKQDGVNSFSNEFTEISSKYEKTSNESLSQEFSKDEPEQESISDLDLSEDEPDDEEELFL